AHDEDHEHEEAHAESDVQEAPPGDGEPHDHDEGGLTAENAKLESVSAVLVGLRSKMGLFRMRAWIGDFKNEPLMAVMPAVAFQQLWSTVSVAENGLRVIGILVSLAAIVALVATVLSTVQERRREMALLRSVGASPFQVASIIMGEAILVAFSSVVFALAAVQLAGQLGGAALAARYGLRLSSNPLTIAELPWIGAFLLTAAIISLIPAVVSYRRSLSDGLLART
ncbi:MAG: ABC transporter permease, partial [Myxococcota bacterium]